jgi:DNA polymerase III subunit epsilon
MTSSDAGSIPAPLRDRARLFILPPLSAADARAHFDRIALATEDDVKRNQCRLFIDQMCANPRTHFDPFNIRLHGIGPDHVAGALPFAEAFETLLPLLTRHHLIQHSNFDKQAINAAHRFLGLEPPPLNWSDSVRIARRAWPELKGNGGHGLANLKQVLNLRFHHHDAGEDARAAAMVVLHAEAHLAMTFDEIARPVPTPPRPRVAKA